MRRTPFSCSRPSRKSAVVSLIGTSFRGDYIGLRSITSIQFPPFFSRQTFLRRAAGPAHRDALRLDRLARIRRPVLLVLKPAAGVALALEGFRIALLLVGPIFLV